MSLINEIAKLRADTSGSGGGTLGHFASPTSTQSPIAQKDISAGSSAYVSGNSYVESSSSYRRIFNHGSGQFSIGSRHYLSQGGNSAEVYVRPFQVNQTTGAITEGTGAALFSGSSNIDTGTFAQNGNYVMTQHTSGSNGNGASACTVSGNSVSGTATYFSNSSNMQPATNADASSFRTGSTMYMYPHAYNANDGRFRRLSLSYNGSSISMPEGPNDPGSITSTNYSYPVAPQNGQTTASNAGIRAWTGSSYLTKFDLLNTSGSYDTEINSNSILAGSDYGPTTGHGLQLSNGRQLFYLNNGCILLRDGSSLTNVSSTADFIPKQLGNTIRDISAGGETDTWITVSSSPYHELVKFYVNPTTYRVTILGSVPLFKFTKLNNFNTTTDSHVSLTGSSNQFIVVGRYHSGQPGATINVFQNPFLV
jgi:hypothetical protein